jgi:predicted glycogen debranching enzyme
MSPQRKQSRGSATRGKRSSRAKSPQGATVDSQSAIRFGPELCQDLGPAEQREWLVTNGIGGFASGTVAGSATRRYHGLLFAALQPPAGRTLLVAGLDELLSIDGRTIALATHRWSSGTIAPGGYQFIQNFRLDGLIPVWTYQAGGARIEKRICMRHGENTTFVQYHLVDSDLPVGLDLKALVNYRDFHSSTHAGDWRMSIDPVENGARITAFDGATPFYLKSAGATCELQHTWYRDFFFQREHQRGLDDREDQLFATFFRAELKPGQTVTIVFSTEKDTDLDGDAALREEAKRQRRLQDSAKPLLTSPDPGWSPLLSQLILAADQFVVERPLAGQTTGKTVVAGYHWFGDWGRDTMIALPGLALATGRPGVARQVLLAFSKFVDAGMLPNNFPDAGGIPEYNTMDATLWYFEAVRHYFAATNDAVTLKKLFPILADIVAFHVEGTRYNIHVDSSDGLLYGGGPGIQLTWMDAKIGDWVVTPRTGKPVEINALWIRTLETMAEFAKILGLPADFYQQLLATAESNFGKFWNVERNCCYDVLESPGIGNDPSLRPNQLLAVALHSRLLSFEQQKAVLQVCKSHLLTPVGLRSLAPGEPGYVGVYSGGPRDRDAAYHQGTVWGWLLGPFASAHYRIYKDRAAALAFLEPLMNAINSYGLGTLGEVFDGDAPHHPGGCVAQAWTVGELLRAYQELRALPAGGNS